jgi:hypothetical protein
MATRRLSNTQVTKLVEGAEAISEAVGLSVAEVVALVLSEPEDNDEPAKITNGVGRAAPVPAV